MKVLVIGLTTSNGDKLNDICLNCDLSGFKGSLAVMLYRLLCQSLPDAKEMTFADRLIYRGAGNVKLESFHSKNGDHVTIDAANLYIHIGDNTYPLAAYVNKFMPNDNSIRAAIGYSAAYHYPFYGKETLVSTGSVIYQFFKELDEYKKGKVFCQETHTRLKNIGYETIEMVEELEGRTMHNIKDALQNVLPAMETLG
ncbi:hypothetical protein [Vibrio harveyi]|uniref:hypothetical protein n=1 Tax=Vibrio harveyi TaxID=669 RepID=UPI003CF3E180